MHGNAESAQLAGLTPRLLKGIFAAAEARPEAKISVQCSYVELYNEAFRDLLGEDSAAPAANTFGTTP